jgi:hypothetical protein
MKAAAQFSEPPKMSRIRERLLSEVDDFLDATGMSARALGIASVGDHRLITRLRDRRWGTTLTRLERLESTMDDIREQLAANAGPGSDDDIEAAERSNGN